MSGKPTGPLIHRLVSSPQLNYVFDTNAVRFLGRALDENEWQTLYERWKAKKLMTGWIPWVVAEVAGSNLLTKDYGEVISPEELREIVCAVRRFDRLANREMLPTADAIAKSSFYSFAEVPNPPAAVCPNENWYRDLIEACKRLTGPHQISCRRNGDNVSVDLEVDGFKAQQTVNRNFTRFADERVEDWKARTTLGPDATDLDLIKDIVKYLPQISWSYT